MDMTSLLQGMISLSNVDMSHFALALGGGGAKFFLAQPVKTVWAKYDSHGSVKQKKFLENLLFQEKHHTIENTFLLYYFLGQAPKTPSAKL